MKYEVKFTTQFKKDLKLAKKQNKDIALSLSNWLKENNWMKNIETMI